MQIKKIFIKELFKSFNEQLELKSLIIKKNLYLVLKKFLWIKKYNSQFIHPWR